MMVGEAGLSADGPPASSKSLMMSSRTVSVVVLRSATLVLFKDTFFDHFELDYNKLDFSGFRSFFKRKCFILCNFGVKMGHLRAI